jgi:probable HAF family extracellular repeat protein
MLAALCSVSAGASPAAAQGDEQPTDIVISEATAASAVLPGTNTVEWFDLDADITRVAPGHSITVMSGLSVDRTGRVASVDLLTGLIVIDTAPVDWPGVAAGDLIAIAVGTSPGPPPPEPPPITEVISVAMEGTTVTGSDVVWVDSITDLSLVSTGQPVTVLDGPAIGLTGTVADVDATAGQITINTGTDDWTGTDIGHSISIDVTPPPEPEPITEVISVADDGTYVVTDAVVWVDHDSDLSLVSTGQPVTVLDGAAEGLTGVVAQTNLADDQLLIDTGTDDWAGVDPGDSISIDVTPEPEAEPTPPPAAPMSEELGTLGGSANFALARSDAGEVAGAALLTDDVAAHAFVWDSTNGLTDLGTLGGTDSIAVAIDPTGALAGSSQVTDDLGWHAFIGDRVSGLTDLGTLGGTNSYASGFDELGRVIGVSQTLGDLTFRAFAWDPINGMVDIGEPEPTEVISFAMEGTGVNGSDVLWVDSVTDLTLVAPGHPVTVLTGAAGGRTGVVVNVSTGSGIVIDTGADDWTGIIPGDSLRVDLTAPPPEPPPAEPPPAEPTEVISIAGDATVNGSEVTWIDDGNADLSPVAPGQAVTVLDGLAADLTGTVVTVDTTTGELVIDTDADDWTGTDVGDSIRIDLGSAP